MRNFYTPTNVGTLVHLFFYETHFQRFQYIRETLQNKGLVKIQNFKKNPNKVNYFYVLTPAGIAEKTKLTLNFMKRKMKEYDELKRELDN